MFWKRSKQPHDIGRYFNQDNDRVDQKSRLQRLDSLVEQLKNTAKQSPRFTDFAEFLDKYWSKLREVEQDITPQQLGELFTSFLTFLNAFNQSSHIELSEESPPTETNLGFSGFNKAQLEVILDSIIVVFLIGSIWKANAVDSDDSRKYAVLVAKVVTWKLDSISSEPHISTAALGFSLWKLMTHWEGKPENDNVKDELRPPYNNEHTKSNVERHGYESNNQLEGKFLELHRIAARCDIAARKLREDIADSMEVANKTVQITDYQDGTHESGEWWATWWWTFLREWGYRCFTRCLSRCGNLTDYETIQNQWSLNFEPLWEIGCEIARTDRLDNMKKGLSGHIAHRWQQLPVRMTLSLSHRA